MLALKEFRTKAAGFSDLLNYAAMVDDGVMLGKDGSLSAAWHWRGPDLSSSTQNELSIISAQLNQMFTMLGAGWMMHVDAVRRFVAAYPTTGEFPDKTTLVMDEERRAIYSAEGAHLETVFTLTLTYLPAGIGTRKFTRFLFEGEGVDKTQSMGSAALSEFRQKTADFEMRLASIGDIQCQRMRARTVVSAQGEEYVRDDFLGHITHCISGVTRPVRLPKVPMYLDTLLGAHPFVTGVSPRIGPMYIKAVSVEGLPGESIPGLLHNISDLPFEYRWSTRFIWMDPYEARKKIEGVRRKWAQKQRGLKDQIFNTGSGSVDLDALEMTQDTESAIGEAESMSVKFGYYTATIIVLHPDHDVATKNASELAKVLMNMGFGARVEDVNAVEAYLGSLPTHGYPNVRRPILHTLNLADLLPITSVWAGEPVHPSPMYPPNSPPLCHASTSGATPFRLSLHVDDVGHTLMLGPTGSGKTTALNFLMAQHFRYPRARVFGFDRKQGAKVLTLAAGGDYYDIGQDNQNLSFCPLGNIHSQSERVWASEWLESLCILQGVNVQARQRELIFEALQRLAGSQTRSLTEFIGEVQDTEIRTALRQYTLEGPLGQLLDAEQDNMSYSNFMMFELEHLSAMGEKNAVPVLLYLFHIMEKRMDGAPTLVPLDESWLMLSHPLFRDKLREWLKTWRSKNAAVILATQEPADVINSEIRDAVLASCATKLLLANPDAASVQRPLYEVMGLNEREIEIIASCRRKRDYYYTSPLGRRLFSLGLGPVALSFCGASSKDDLAAMAEVEKSHGVLWPGEWLRRRGLADWGDYWDWVTVGGEKDDA